MYPPILTKHWLKDAKGGCILPHQPSVKGNPTDLPIGQSYRDVFLINFSSPMTLMCQVDLKLPAHCSNL